MLGVVFGLALEAEREERVGQNPILGGGVALQRHRRGLFVRTVC